MLHRHPLRNVRRRQKRQCPIIRPGIDHGGAHRYIRSHRGVFDDSHLGRSRGTRSQIQNRRIVRPHGCVQSLELRLIASRASLA